MIGDDYVGQAHTTYRYVHHPDAGSEFKQCLPSHRQIPCGECIVQIDDEWWITYRWFTDSFTEDGTDALINGEISQAEYDQRSEEAIDTCWRDGYAAMGYEIPEEPEQ